MKKLLILLIAIVFVGGCAGQGEWDGYIKSYRSDCALISRHDNVYVILCGENLHVITWGNVYGFSARIVNEQIIPLDKFCLVAR